jgi:hypothetical protein
MSIASTRSIRAASGRAQRTLAGADVEHVPGSIGDEPLENREDLVRIGRAMLIGVGDAGMLEGGGEFGVRGAHVSRLSLPAIRLLEFRLVVGLDVAAPTTSRNSSGRRLAACATSARFMSS